MMMIMMMILMSSDDVPRSTVLPMPLHGPGGSVRSKLGPLLSRSIMRMSQSRRVPFQLSMSVWLSGRLDAMM